MAQYGAYDGVVIVKEALKEDWIESCKEADLKNTVVKTLPDGLYYNSLHC